MIVILAVSDTASDRSHLSLSRDALPGRVQQEWNLTLGPAREAAKRRSLLCRRHCAAEAACHRAGSRITFRFASGVRKGRSTDPIIRKRYQASVANRQANDEHRVRPNPRNERFPVAGSETRPQTTGSAYPRTVMPWHRIRRPQPRAPLLLHLGLRMEWPTVSQKTVPGPMSASLHAARQPTECLPFRPSRFDWCCPR